ncbi:HdeD family acid-resistance protein [Rhodosalinus sp.]|uniref:HdeD family acid-resistance protein n=1 Tax=Rhodosalinus sp. TaxID=2047741 RepID=UPI00397C9681
MTSTEFERAAQEMDWRWLMVFGVIMLIGGLLALANPFAASITAEILAASAFIAGGVVQIWIALRGTAGADSGTRWLAGTLGVLFVLLGIVLLANPLAGLLTLTIAVGALFAGMGAARIALAIRWRPQPGWGWMAASGALSLILAALILFTLPGSALGILGLLLGIDLTVSGAVSLALAWRARPG